MIRRLQEPKGFTMIEAIVVIVVIGIIAASFPVFFGRAYALLHSVGGRDEAYAEAARSLEYIYSLQGTYGFKDREALEKVLDQDEINEVQIFDGELESEAFLVTVSVRYGPRNREVSLSSIVRKDP